MTLRERILARLEGETRFLTVADIHADVGGTRPNISDEMTRLRNRGRVELGEARPRSDGSGGIPARTYRLIP